MADSHPLDPPTPFAALKDNLAFLDDWEERYRYVIELGRTLAPLADADRSPATKVEGCASQVWLKPVVGPDADPTGAPILRFAGDSDAHIVRGLIAVLFALYSGRTAAEIRAIDAEAELAELGLDSHLSPQRANGLRAMVERIRRIAAKG